MHFEDKGLFLSFVSYPFFIDGRKLYNETLKVTFAKHKDKLRKFDPDGFSDQYLYKPEGYRMFGSHGLVVLSLVDDHMFSHRHFNKNHLQSLLKENETDAEPCEHVFNFKSEIVSGVTEAENESLESKAEDSFLRKTDRFPFIGIIRMKIDQRLLRGKGNGIETTRRIKKQIDILANRFQETHRCTAAHISIDCFNNDELITVAFSDSLLFLFDFLGEVRSIKNNDVRQKYKEKKDGKDTSYEKHMFGTTYISFGYNVDYPDCKKTFLSPLNSQFNSFTINCLIETKPGHCDMFFDYLRHNNKLNVKKPNRNATGGCHIVASMKMSKIFDLETMCQKDKTFQRDVRNIKVSIQTPANYVKSSLNDARHSQSTPIKDPIEEGYIQNTKSLMKRIGVSKMMRERLLSLFELYNRAYHDLLQQLFLDELKPVLEDYYTMMEEMYKGGASIRMIEEAMNEQINCMESACYDRMHHHRHSASLLEYSSGIQQHLTAFDYAYKTIYKAFVFSSEEPKVYVAVTGAERAASERTLFMMNINDIVFPELFITAAWKEMANFAFNLLLDYDGQYPQTPLGEEVNGLLENWNRFLKSEELDNILKYNLSHSEMFHSSDRVFATALGLISRELIEYFFKDFLIFHFAFQRNLEKTWYFLLKTLLQTTAVYQRFNEIYEKHLIYMLLRLFMMAQLSKTGKPKDAGRDAEIDEFVSQQASKPFDSVLAKTWIECFVKVKKVAENLFETLEAFDFKKVNTTLVFNNEHHIGVDKELFASELQSGEIVKICLEERKKVVKKMEEQFEKGQLVTDNDSLVDVEYIVSIFQAYMNCIYRLDQHDKPIRAVPRNKDDGRISKVLAIQDDKKSSLYDHMISILSDATGGFFVPSAQTRKEYFRLRTTLYRSLWNYRFTHTNPKNSDQ